MRRHVTSILAALAAVFIAGCGKQEEPTATAAGEGAVPAARLQIAVIPKGTTHIFWRSVHAGAVKAGQELNVDVIWQGPQKEDDGKMQIEVVEGFVSRQVDAIVLAPLDDQALVRPVERAVNQGIPVVVIDSGLQTDAYASFVATDNRAGGRIAGEHLGKLLAEDADKRVMMMRYAEGSASTRNREEGFLEGIRAALPDVNLVSINQHGGVTANEAQQKAQSLLNKYTDLDGIFTPNESTTFGMLRALQQAGRAGRQRFIGFDASEPLLDGLRAGEIDALVVQNPMRMGYLGVKTAVATLRGENVDKRVDTGVQLVTREGLDDPVVMQVVAPDLSKWLGE